MKPDKTNAGKYALITGATSGFGYEFAKLFAKDGYNLVLVARTDDRLQEVATEITQEFYVDVLPMSKDLFDPKAAEEIYAEVNSKGIVVDILVNDAGQGEHGDFLEYPLARDVDMIQLNITSLVSLTKLFLKDMVARNEGKVLQVASLLGKYPTPLMSVYAATKAFVIAFTEGLINELKDTNVTLTALLPGASDTDFFHKAGAEDTATYKEEKLSKPQEVARDGYEALMEGKSRIVSGAKNKIQAAMSNVMPDSSLASSMRKKMDPSHEPGRDHITHGPSIEERERIEQSTGRTDGDYDEHKNHVHNKEFNEE
jgi:short-subunit dehydrogenase